MIRNALRSLLIATAAASLLAGAAKAQVPSYALPPLQLATYSAAFNFTPAVTASKDLLTIVGSATKIVRVTRLQCSGTSTAAASIPVVLNKYLTAPTTGGTAVTGTAVPADSNDAVATAVAKVYTAAGTVGTGGGAVRSGTLQTNLPAGNAAVPTTWEMTGRIPERLGIVLRGVNQAVSLTVGATALSAGTALNCDVEWTEQ